jgi:outer membrane receptor protein involved in Fe transport
MSLIRLVTLSLLAIGGLLAQGQYGSIGGLVLDATGALVPGAIITVTQTDTGQPVRVVSDEEGRYLAPQLLPGFYSVQAERAGFKVLSVSQVKVDINQNVALDLTLELGTVTETVSVSSAAVLVTTVSGSIGHVVDNKEIVELPLNGRNVFDLVTLVPGSFRAPGGQISIGGGRTTSALAMLDGIVNSRGGLADQNIEMNPPIDLMQEFKVETNNYSAQYGRTNSGVVNATTRSGTNEFRGTLYEFLRNDILDSRGWNADRKAPLRRNQFGAAIGGPIARNRTFFFYNYDAFRESRGVVRTRTVPLSPWRQGDFFGLVRQQNTASGPVPVALPLYDPASGQREVFPNNRIPASRLDPVAVKALSYVPLPNRPPDNPITQGGNWQENSVNPPRRDHHTMRIDHAFSDRTRIFGRYLLVSPDENNTGGTHGFGIADPDMIRIRNRRQNLAFNLSHVLSPAAFLNLRWGANRVFIRRTGSGFGEGWPAQLGVKGVAPDVFPRFTISSGQVPTANFGTTGNQNRRAALTNTEYHANLSLIRGSHTLKLGVDYHRYNGNEDSRQTASGEFVSSTRFTQGLRADGSVIANTGMTLADFLLGRLTSVTAEVGVGVGRRIQYYAGYVEDDWKVTGRLTLTLGLRYDVETPLHELKGRFNNFDPYTPHPLAGVGQIPAGARGVVTFPNRNGKGKYLVDWDKNNFSPRFGFAWRPFGTNNSAVRGGFGVFYGNPSNRNIVQPMDLGFNGIATFREPVPFPLQQGLPAGALTFPAEQDLTPAFGARGTRWPQSRIQFLDPRRRTQYGLNYNLTVQHQWKQVLFEGAYLANLGRKVVFPNINLNHIPPDLLPRTEIPERLRRPWAQFDSDRPQIQIISPNWGLSNYHAFTFKSEKRFSSGYGWIVSYAWSKWIDNLVFVGGDDATFGDDDQIQNIYDLRNERSLSTNHIPHRLVATPIVELPVGQGKKWLNRTGPLDWILGGWEVSTIATIQSGSPFGATVVNGPRDILGDPSDGKNLRPNIVGNIHLPASQKGQPAAGQRGIQWFNPDAFAPPPRFTHGNAARTVMLGPGTINFDLAVLKNFRFRERYRLQFRWESFNAFNTPQFGPPGNGLGGAGFGISGAGASDREMQFALKLYF